MSSSTPLDATLRWADMAAPVRTLGPGARAALWVQGCDLGCPGCTTPESWDSSSGTLSSVRDVAERLLAADVSSTLNGLTLSGGEPLQQASALLELWRSLRTRRPHWTLVLFTGYRQAEILRDLPREAGELFHAADMVVTGRYVAPLDTGRGMRGSRNQRIEVRRPDWLPMLGQYRDGPREIELHFGGDELLFVGVPPRGFRQVVASAGVLRQPESPATPRGRGSQTAPSHCPTSVNTSPPTGEAAG